MEIEFQNRLLEPESVRSGAAVSGRGSRTIGSDADVVLRADEVDDVQWMGGGDDLSLVLGQPFHRVTLEEALEQCEEMVGSGVFRHVVTANSDFLAQADRNPEAKRILLEADRIFCDGMPLVWLSRFLKKCLPERVAGSDLTPKLLQRCAQRGWSVFLFGSNPRTMEALNERLPRLYPGLRIVGSIAPPYGKTEEWDNPGYLAEIRRAKPDVFLSALGFPKQDIWIDRYLRPSVSTLAIGVGASLDFLVGAQVRAPRWMQRCGLEWSWRMASDPQRLVKRYVDDFWSILRLVAKHVAVRCLPFRVERSAPGCNGISAAAERVVVSDGADWGDLRAQVVRSGFGFVVIDCSEVHRPCLDLCARLVELARAARQRGKKAALFGGGARIGAYMKTFGLEESLPVFEHPLALEAWVENQTEIISDRPRKLRVPANLTSLRVKRYRSCVREISRRLRMEGESVQLCLNEVNGLSVVAMVERAPPQGRSSARS